MTNYSIHFSPTGGYEEGGRCWVGIRRTICICNKNRAAPAVRATQHIYHTIWKRSCKSALSPNFSPFFYGTSHLEKSHSRRYDEDTKKE